MKFMAVAAVLVCVLGCGGGAPSREKGYETRTARLACDYNPRITTDVPEGNLLDLAAVMMQTRNGIQSARVVPGSQILEIQYRDDRITEKGIVGELIAYFRGHRLNVNVTPVE